MGGMSEVRKDRDGIPDPEQPACRPLRFATTLGPTSVADHRWQKVLLFGEFGSLDGTTIKSADIVGNLSVYVYRGAEGRGRLSEEGVRVPSMTRRPRSRLSTRIWTSNTLVGSVWLPHRQKGCEMLEDADVWAGFKIPSVPKVKIVWGYSRRTTLA